LKFYPKNKPVPEKLITSDFLIRPLRTTDVELDYQAVIASREKLLKRTAGRWPKVGFTIDENLSDLESHEQQHKQRTEFTFTIMNVVESECLGCVYILPLTKLLKGSTSKNEIASLNIKDYEAWLTFWVTPGAAEQNLDEWIVDKLRSWFSEKWAFSKVVLSFGSQATAHELQMIKKVELKLRFSFQTSEGTLLAWELY
jgi:hypothetical protein